MKAGKIWGNTELIEHNNTFEFHRIEFMQIIVAVNTIIKPSGMVSL